MDQKGGGEGFFTHVYNDLVHSAVCSKKFIQKGKLNNHRENKHPNETEYDNKNDSKKFQCHVCNKRFTQKGTMNRHTKTLHPNDAQPPIDNRRRSQQNYKCTNCTKFLEVFLNINDVKIVKSTLKNTQER